MCVYVYVHVCTCVCVCIHVPISTQIACKWIIHVRNTEIMEESACTVFTALNIVNAITNHYVTTMFLPFLYSINLVLQICIFNPCMTLLNTHFDHKVANPLYINAFVYAEYMHMRLVLVESTG